MAEYGAAFKARVVKQLVGPQAVSATRLAAAVGVPQPTLSRWVREVRSVEGSCAPERGQRVGYSGGGVSDSSSWCSAFCASGFKSSAAYSLGVRPPRRECGRVVL